MHINSRINLFNFAIIIIIGAGEGYPSFQIIGDNVDLCQHVSCQSFDRPNKDHHWFQLFAVRDRVCAKDHSTALPSELTIKNLPLQKILPSTEECQIMNTEIEVLISRVLIKHLSYFATFKHLVPEHIPHKYSSEMKKNLKL